MKQVNRLFLAHIILPLYNDNKSKPSPYHLLTEFRPLGVIKLFCSVYYQFDVCLVSLIELLLLKKVQYIFSYDVWLTMMIFFQGERGHPGIHGYSPKEGPKVSFDFCLH